MHLPAASAMQDVGQIASHNTNTNSDWISHLDHVNAVELDVWPLDNWTVSHNFDVNAGHLDGYMSDLAKWRKKHTNHDLITVFLEIKSKEGWRVDDFESILLRHFRRTNLFSPMDLVKWGRRNQSTARTLRELVEDKGWPAFSEVKNQVMFVVNNDGDHVVNTYLAERPLVKGRSWSGVRDRKSWPLCFVMSSRDDARTGCENIVIFNDVYDGWPTPPDPSDNKCLRRAYEVKSGNDEMAKHGQTEPARRLMKDKGINYLCYDQVENAFWTPL